MLDYDRRLEDLILKYNLQTNFYKCTFLEYRLLDELRKLPKDFKIAIWGGGIHTEQLIKLVPLSSERIECILDHNPNIQGEEKFGYPVFSPEYINDEGIDYVIISSFSFRKEIAYELETLYPKCEYIDIYAIYDKIETYKVPFYHISNYHNFSTFTNLFILKELYNNEENIVIKEKYLLELIAQYLKLRDFLYSIKFLKLYINKGYSRSESLKNFLNELENLFEEIKENLGKIDKQHILLFLVDSLRDKDIFTTNTEKLVMPYLNRLSKDSISFKNAFCTSTYTRTCIRSMFTGELPLDDEGYKKKYGIQWSDSPLLVYLTDKEYEIYNFSSTIKFIPNLEKKHSYYHEKDSLCMTKDFWLYICNLFKNNNLNSFTLMHFFEAHTPYACGYHDKPIILREPVDWYLNYGSKGYTYEDITSQYIECLSYIDKQFEFYLDFLPQNILKIIFGDHGQLIGENEGIGQVITWHDEVIHVPFILNWDKLISTTYNSLFSMNNFYDQLIHILEFKKIKEYSCSYIEVQRDPVYNQGILKNRKAMEKIDNRFLKAFKLVRSSYDKYILYDDGSEEYYVLPDESKNLINDIKFSERIKNIRQRMINVHFPKFKDNKYRVRKEETYE